MAKCRKRIKLKPGFGPGGMDGKPCFYVQAVVNTLEYEMDQRLSREQVEKLLAHAHYDVEIVI